MSGGAFDYQQHRISEIADEVRRLIETNDISYGYPPEVIAEFRTGLYHLERAAVYVQRIDWLVSDDDGEERFLERLREELDKLEEV